MSATTTPGVTAPVSNETDTSVIITVAACIGGLFLIVIIIFIAFVIYFYKKQMREDEFEKKPQSHLRIDELHWNSRSLGQQFGDINDIDEMLWREGGRDVDEATANPAFGKDFEPLDVNTLKGFDSVTDDAVSTQETDSTSDMVEIKMDEEDGGTDGNGEDSESQKKKQISILDMKTWGQPGSSRHNSMRRGYSSPFAHGPPSPDELPDSSDYGYDRRGSFKSQDGSSFPFSVSQPSNDPRFDYTRTNPLMAEAMDRGMPGGLPFSSSDRDYESNRDFGGSQDIESVEFDRSNTLRGSRRNQSVVDFYESGTRTTGSSFNFSLEGNNSVGKNLLWQNKKFSGFGGVHTN